MANEAILNVAIRQFGDRGYDGASTRAIAAAAGTVMSSITYHFGGKEGLYLACAGHIGSQIAARLAPVADAVGPIGEMSRDDAVKAIQAIILQVARLMMSDESSDWAGFVIREQQNPGPAFDRLYQCFLGRIEQLLLALVLRARPELEDRDARMLGITLFGQALVLRAARATVTRILGVSDLEEADRNRMLERIRRNIDLLMRSDPPS